MLLSQEGTTQGNPLAMAMYAIAVVPMIKSLHSLSDQIWFADDATGSGQVETIHRWWDKLNIIGPDYGDIPQPP